VDISIGFKDLLKVIIDSGYSRIPAYDGNFENISGILYIKDLLPHLDEKDHFQWSTLLRGAFFVPENKRINDLLQEFQEKKMHMAIVVDEYGGTAGIVTLEDIIEEIVGEISDEHDPGTGEVEFTRLDEKNFLFEGKTSLNDFCKIIGIDDDTFDEVKGDTDSLAGLILELMEKMPEKDEKVDFAKFRFTVKVVDKRRIKKVLVSLIDGSEN
jgi:CBS domain containing-hemolysin-like protein